MTEILLHLIFYLKTVGPKILTDPKIYVNACKQIVMFIMIVLLLKVRKYCVQCAPRSI